MSRESKRKLTPPEVAARYGISPDKVVAWIRNGELRAVNGATKPTGRPRWLIDEADLIAFERKRSAQAAPTLAVPRRRRQTEGVISFF